MRDWEEGWDTVMGGGARNREDYSGSVNSEQGTGLTEKQSSLCPRWASLRHGVGQ